MELILLTGLLALLIWGAVYLRIAGLWGCILLTLIVGTVFGHSFFHLSMLTADRSMLGVCLIVYAAYRWFGIAEPKGWLSIDSIFLGFLLVMVLSTLTSDGRRDNAAPFSKLLFFFLIPAVMYWLARQIELTPLRIRWMFATFAGLGFYLAVTSVAEKFELRWAVFPRYISDPSIIEFLGRGRGPLLNPSGNGILLTLGLSCALMFYPMASKLARIAVISSIPVYLAGIYCTLTRCVWMGGLAALVGIACLAIPRRFRIPFAIAILFAGGFIVVAKSESFISFKRDKNVSVADMRQSAQLRPILAVTAWQMFQDRPLIGCGTGQYLSNVKDYLGERRIDLPLEKAKIYVQHNIFLALLVENGLLGMLPFAILLGYWTWWSWKLWQSKELSLEYRQMGLVFMGFLAGYLCNGMFQDVLIIPMMGMYLFFMGGCIRNLTHKHVMLRPAIAASRTSHVAQSKTQYPLSVVRAHA